MNVIRPLPTVRLTLDRSLMTYRFGAGRPEQVYPTLWFIEGPRRKIVVDTGTDAAIARRLGYEAEQIAWPDQALGRLGLSMPDIEVLILTHLHWDHVAFARGFTRAKVFVQRTEYEAALDPHPWLARGYIRETFHGLPRLEILDGDAEIDVGVSVLFTPGHTPGGQSVAVATEKGRAVISGLCSIKANFFPPPEIAGNLKVIPPGIHTDVLQAYDSLVRLKETADLIVPLHDGEYCFKEAIPW
ncbi:MAG: N-acyl homoserine lactonase family protein [Thermodesulfobacteriota bacterium]